jgi:predicted RNA-binding protein with PIN domain
MLYLIDGYNLLFRLKSKKQTLKDAREFLVKALGTLVKDFELKATIVFDSSLDMAHLFPSKAEKPPLEIIFAPYGMSADEYLLEIISFKSKKQPITLVTSDQLLSTQAREFRVKTITIEELFDTFSQKALAKTMKEEIVQKELYEKKFSNLFDHFLEEFEKRSKK